MHTLHICVYKHVQRFYCFRLAMTMCSFAMYYMYSNMRIEQLHKKNGAILWQWCVFIFGKCCVHSWLCSWFIELSMNSLVSIRNTIIVSPYSNNRSKVPILLSPQNAHAILALVFLFENNNNNNNVDFNQFSSSAIFLHRDFSDDPFNKRFSIVHARKINNVAFCESIGTVASIVGWRNVSPLVWAEMVSKPYLFFFCFHTMFYPQVYISLQ